MTRRQLVIGTGICAAIVFLCGSAAAQQLGFPASPIGYQPPSGINFALVMSDIVVGILGYLVGAFFSPLMRPYRRLLLIGAFALAVLYSWFGHDLFAIGLNGILSIIIFIIGVVLGLQLGADALRRGYFQLATPTSFGTAKWATHAYLSARRMFLGQGFFLGEFGDGRESSALHYPGDRHLLTVAPTRSGKGVSAIIPNLVSYEGSVLVIDPKGENALMTAARRGAGDKRLNIPGMGQEVFLVDPWDIAASSLGMEKACFNPLDWIKAGDQDAAENAFLLADALVHQEPGESGGGNQRFWDEEAKAYLTGLILFVATSPSEASSRTLGRVRDIINMSESRLREIHTTMSQSDEPIVRSTSARTVAKDSKLLSNMMAAVQSHTHFLDSRRIRESLSASDFTFEQLKSKPTTVYLILPADRLKTFDRFQRLLIQQAITVNARNIQQKPAKPVLFLLDEMPSLGRLTMLEQAYGLMAGFGMVLWSIVQDLNQLEALYGKSWQTFISNSGVIQYFGSRDEHTAEYFSKLCGVTTVRIFSISRAIGDVIGSSWSNTTTMQGGSSTYGENKSHSDTRTVGSNESQRKLAYADELMVLKGNDQIIFIENFDPIRATKVTWFNHPKLKGLAVNLQPNAVPPSSPDPGASPPLMPKLDLSAAMVGVSAIRAALPSKAPANDAKPRWPKAPTADGDEKPPAQPKPYYSAAKQRISAADVKLSMNLQPEPPPPPPARKEVNRYEQGDVTFISYSDNSIDRVDAEGNVQKFKSLDELKAFFARRPN